MLKQNLGYYQVDDIIFENKISAILHASAYGKEVKWNFCNEIFNNVNWLNEPQLSIDEYYRLRAQQIRDNYDYVIIRCSGGADSTNVLYSFLNNNIMPDEVIGESPLSGLKNWQWNNRDTNIINTPSEFIYTQIPLLKEISAKFSTIKVTHVDSFERIINPEPDRWFFGCNDGIDYHASIEGTFWNLEYLHKLAENGKSIAVVSGTDKPFITVDDDNNILSILSDLPLNYLKPPLRENFENVHRVPFYWTPDFPDLIIKMSHIVAKKTFGKNKDFRLWPSIKSKMEQVNNSPSIELFEKNNIKNYLTRTLTNYTPMPNLNYNPGNEYQRLICQYIYPSTFNSSIFQANKNNAEQTFFSPLQDWFRILHKDSRAIQIIHSDFANFYKFIDNRFFNSAGTAFIKFNKKYTIGSLNNFSSRI